MARLVWDNEDSPMYQTGVSKGVFYGDDGVGHAWSGLISVTEKPQTNAPTAIYNAMGSKYDTFGNVAEKKHGLSCYTYPEVMDNYLGYEYLEDFGFTVDERPPKKFHMAYRVELGNGLYEIHVLLNQIATFGETSRQTKSNNAAPSTITMNLEGAVDPRLGTSHIRLDSRLPITKSAEVLLFGDQYTDANINDFLTAKPVWETVATNYAPIIEPDYDNMVWLGGENLALGSGTGWSSSTYYMIPDQIQLSDVNIQAGETVTISLKGTLGSDREYFSVFNSGGMLKLVDLKPADRGPDGVFRVTFNWRDTHPTATVTNDRLSVYNAPNTGTTESTIEWIKLERGSIATPWTPAPSDPNQNPLPIDPYPENYKPGVKGARPSTSTTAFYDEQHKGLGVYAYRTSGYSFTFFQTVPIQEVLNSYIRLNTEVILNENLVNPSVRSGSMRVSETGSTITPPNRTVGTHVASYETNSHTSNLLTGYDYVYFYHGAEAHSGYITYRNPMVTTSPTTEFFDANSIPPTKGDRYVRAQGIDAEYTLHQQLRLRSTSKVKLRDITQYDFWLEAADSMLLSQNETFTFNGPQAVIDGDTFTIDDSIQGYAEG